MNRLLICLLATTLFTVSSHAAADLKKIAADIDGYR